jgi:hypothetical protein
MTLFVFVVLVVIVVWWFARTPRRAPDDVPSTVPDATVLEQVAAAVDDVFRAGTGIGYEIAWQQQVEAEALRVAQYLRVRRRRVLIHLTLASALATPFVLAGAGAWAALPSWLPVWAPAAGEPLWFLVAAAAAAVYLMLSRLLGLPSYRAVHRHATSAEADLQRLRAKGFDLSADVAVSRLEVARHAAIVANRQQFELGLQRGRLEARESSFAAGVAEGQRQGRAAGRAEVQQATVEQQARRSAELNQAYLRGKADGEVSLQQASSAAVGAAREAGRREGFREGLERGRSEGAATARRGASPRDPMHGKPATRDDALRILDLPATASAEDVDAQFRRFRREMHPDNFPSAKYPRAQLEFAELEFKRLVEARDLLIRSPTR